MLNKPEFQPFKKLNEDFGWCVDVKPISKYHSRFYVQNGENDIKELGLKTTDNLYDIVLWPKEGIFDITELREGDRLIYDIPYQEMVLLARSINKSGEELYRSILEHFNLQVLTKKAFDYLSFVEKKM